MTKQRKHLPIGRNAHTVLVLVLTATTVRHFARYPTYSVEETAMSVRRPSRVLNHAGNVAYVWSPSTKVNINNSNNAWRINFNHGTRQRQIQQ